MSNFSSLNSAEVIAYHGWAFDQSCWCEWKNWLEQQGYCLKAVDRGYFTFNKQANFSGNSIKIIFVHSYGLHWCPVEQLNQADALIIFSSFNEFHPEQPSLRKRSQHTIQQMLNQLSSENENDARLMLQKFWTRSYHPIPWHGTISEHINVKFLSDDLNQLNTATIDLTLLRSIRNTVVLHGFGDRIVSSAKGKELAEQLACQYFEIPDAGHALPFTHIEICQSILQPILNMLLNQ
jgi:pimeloyl-[acyl-carrier protein] methyl ester esterase